MRRRNAWLVLLLGFAVSPAAPAADFARRSLLTKSPWVRFDLVLGRLTATHLRAGQNRQSRTPLEKLSIGSSGAAPRIRFERNDGDWFTRLEIVGDSDVLISRQPAATHSLASMRFRQQPGRPIELSIRDEHGVEKVFRQTSIWHLLIAEPAAAEDNLVPILQLMRPDWNLAAMADRVEQRVTRMANDELHVAKEDFDTLVRQLDDPLYFRRQQADRKLREYGVGLLPYIHLLDSQRLSPEQRIRVKKIEERLGLASPDSTVRVSTWLLNDPLIWLTMLADEDREVRELALSRLERLRNESLEFNPAGGEVDRRQQIARLRDSLKYR